jgi:sulfofructose kinase
MRFPFQLKEAAFHVTGFGTNAVDFLIEVPHYPEFNSKVELSDYRQAAGGEIATAMVGLQRLGARTRYAGRFGDDAAGEIGWASLETEGVDLSLAQRVDGARTQVAFIVIDERSGERTVIWKRDAKLAYSSDDAPLAAVEDTSILHITPHDTQACIRLAREARERGVVVSIDIDRAFEGVDELLPLVDVMIGSQDMPTVVTGVSDPRDALLEIQRKFKCPVAGITLGEAGSLILGPEGFIENQGFTVPGGCRDTTGAGDSFRAGFLHGLLRGWTIEESGRAANAVAALKCRAVGARTALPVESELDALLSESRT